MYGSSFAANSESIFLALSIQHFTESTNRSLLIVLSLKYWIKLNRMCHIVLVSKQFDIRRERSTNSTLVVKGLYKLNYIKDDRRTYDHFDRGFRFLGRKFLEHFSDGIFMAKMTDFGVFINESGDIQMMNTFKCVFRMTTNSFIEE